MRLITFLALCAASAALAGCGGRPNPGAKAEMPVPVVTVGNPVERTITRYEFATGRTEPLEQVEIRARVSGYLKALKFEPGREVKKDQPLVEIDPEPYKADLAKAKASQETATADKAAAEAELIRADAKYVTAKNEWGRQEKAFKQGGSSAKEYDKAKGDYDESNANVKANQAKIRQAAAKIDEAKAAVRTAELNLGFCTIAAPIDGIVGDRLVTEGNLIVGGAGNTTLLTTIVAVEKMDIAFDVDENTVQRIQAAVREKKIVMPSPGEVPAEAGLAVHGTDYPLHGKINFYDNKLDPKTGTMRMKARFDNPLPATGKRTLSAGMFARVRVPIGTPSKAMMVPESALGSDQGIRFLYLVDGENKAIRYDAQVGMLENGLRMIESVSPSKGSPRPLTPEDRVIVNGLLRVRPGAVVEPKK